MAVICMGEIVCKCLIYMCVCVRFSIGEYMADSHQNAYPHLMQSLNYAQWFWKFTFFGYI